MALVAIEEAAYLVAYWAASTGKPIAEREVAPIESLVAETGVALIENLVGEDLIDILIGEDLIESQAAKTGSPVVDTEVGKKT